MLRTEMRAFSTFLRRLSCLTLGVWVTNEALPYNGTRGDNQEHVLTRGPTQ